MKRILLFLLLLLPSPLLAQYFGDHVPGEVVEMDFNTRDAAGAPITLAGSPAIKCWKNHSNSDETTSGITLSVDFDGLTGSHHVQVDTSSSSTFYAAGSYIACKLSAGTVSGGTQVGAIVGWFTLFAIPCTSNCGTNFGTFFDNSGSTAPTALVGNVPAIKAKTDPLTYSVTNRVDATPTGTFNVQKNTAFPNFPIWMLNNGGNGITGAAVVCRVQKDGGAWSSTTTNPITEIGLGLYNWNATAAELNANKVAVQCTAAGAVTYRTNVTPQH